MKVVVQFARHKQFQESFQYEVFENMTAAKKARKGWTHLYSFYARTKTVKKVTK